MREVDTVSPVVWPAWCYSGEAQTDSDTVAGVGVRTGTPASLKGRKRALTPSMNGDHVSNNNNNNSVKSERLSPATADNSSSSRSGTPSSVYPGTPPSHPDRGGSPSSTAPQGENLMSRNYSDFMRSLAAKYNNNNPNDYFSSARNGYPPGLDPRFSAFKPGAATPFVGLMAPLGSTSTSTSPTAAPTPSNAKEPSDSELKPGIPTPAEAQQALFANFGLNAFSHPSLPGGVPFLPPLVDMSSTQALLNMVRTASAQSANQLETYLKGAIKRPPENPNNPLDLSSNAVTPPTLKKPRKHTPSLSESLYGPDALLNFPMLTALQRTTKDRLQTKRTGSVSPKPKSKLATTSPSNAATVSRPSTANSCLSLCSTPGEKPCSSSADTQTVAHWTVDDVCSFIGTIDLCAEYVPNFREQRIDGSALPLLTEEHLTSALGMKLGPALKLRAVLSRRLGHCTVCLHCVHCHGAAALSAPSPTAPAAPATPSPAATPVSSAAAGPSGTGN